MKADSVHFHEACIISNAEMNRHYLTWKHENIQHTGRDKYIPNSDDSITVIWWYVSDSGLKVKNESIKTS